MSRKPRDLQPNYCYHVTTRCNNREFKLICHECREVFIYALKRAREKFNFKLYALCGFEQSCPLLARTRRARGFTLTFARYRKPRSSNTSSISTLLKILTGFCMPYMLSFLM